MHPAGGRVPAGSREPAEETAEGGEPVTAKPAANSFQHHGEQLVLGTAAPRSTTMGETRICTHFPLNKTSTETAGQGEGIPGEEREGVHQRCSSVIR